MRVLRTPDERFADLPGFGWEPRYADIGGLRMAYVEAGPADGEPVLLLHGKVLAYMVKKPQKMGLVALVHWGTQNSVVRYAFVPVFLVLEFLFWGLLEVLSERSSELTTARS